MAAWFSILVAASYAFTLGYIDTLKTPITPSATEPFLFYFRAVLLNGASINVVLKIWIPLILFITYIKICRCCIYLRPKTKLLKCAKDIICLILAAIIISAWCTCSFRKGQKALDTSEENSFFPEAYKAITDTQLLRLVWISENKFFWWVDCNPNQPQLTGVENGKEFFIRRLGDQYSRTICSSR